MWKASQTEFVANFLFPVDGGKGFSVAEIVSVRGDRVVKMPRAEVVGEIISMLAMPVGAVKRSRAAENIIRGGGMCIGLVNRISEGEGWLVSVEVQLLGVWKGKLTVIQAL